ncbi:MAG: transcription elongation factor NusA [Syntrophorhabdus sp. PtaB.Bin184]|nr:MAG: transcription elongation factor NusA [Syntrophorhabdus sp. PtaB.Bin184]
MVLSLKVGYLVPGVVVKSMPDHDAHLILISGTELLAFLPKRYANRPHKAGQNLVACVFVVEKGKIILSQRSHHYYIRVAERAFSVLIEEEKIRIKRAVSVQGAGFAKMALEGLNDTDPVRECLPYLPVMKAYTDDTITLVRYSRDIKEYVRNALAPAPSDKIRKVIFSSTLREAVVGVDPAYYGLFVGKGGTNVATAAKLLDITILIRKAEDTNL